MDRFASITDEDIAFLVQEKYSNSTKKVLVLSVALFQLICRKKSYARISFLQSFLQPEELAKYLKKFMSKQGKRMGVDKASQYLLQLGSVYANFFDNYLFAWNLKHLLHPYTDGIL